MIKDTSIVGNFRLSVIANVLMKLSFAEDFDLLLFGLVLSALIYWSVSGIVDCFQQYFHRSSIFYKHQNFKRRKYFSLFCTNPTTDPSANMGPFPYSASLMICSGIARIPEQEEHFHIFGHFHQQGKNVAMENSSHIHVFSSHTQTVEHTRNSH